MLIIRYFYADGYSKAPSDTPNSTQIIPFQMRGR